MRARYLLPAIIAVCMSHPALALHGPTGVDWFPNDRTEQVYFHCEGAAKLHNVVQDGSIPWNITAPTASVTSGAGCGSLDNGAHGSNQVSIQDSHFQGEFAGNIDKITVLAHNIYLGPARQTGSFTVNARLAIDENPVLGVAGKNVTVTPVRSSTGASELIKFTITGINLMTESDDTIHDVLLTLTGGALAVDNPVLPQNDTESIWVYDTTEVPSGLIFNPTSVEGATIPR